MSNSEVQRATVGLIATSPLQALWDRVPNPGGGSMACWELATQQEMSSRQASEALSVITAAPTLQKSLSPITPRWNSLAAGKQTQGSH